ncbi:MAG: VTT domain-containing protein [Caldilineaceae bacterium]
MRKRISARRGPWRLKLVGLFGALLIGICAPVYYRQELSPVLQDPTAMQAFIAALGWWGPLALIALNILQIVIAPIPGYAVYLIAGYLYGAFWGGVWGSLGLLLGSMCAMFVARRLGRPLVERLIDSKTLKRWESTLHSDSWWVWGVLLLSPIGDAPFLLAGLSSIPYSKILVLTLVTRVPMAFAAAALGAGVLHLAVWQVPLIAFLLLIPLACKQVTW